jgi:hypothetical protein
VTLSFLIGLYWYVVYIWSEGVSAIMGFAKLCFKYLDSGRVVYMDSARSCCLSSSGGLYIIRVLVGRGD